MGENGSPHATALSPSMHGPGPRADYAWGSVQGCLKEGEPGKFVYFYTFFENPGQKSSESKWNNLRAISGDW